MVVRHSVTCVTSHVSALHRWRVRRGGGLGAGEGRRAPVRSLTPILYTCFSQPASRHILHAHLDFALPRLLRSGASFGGSSTTMSYCSPRAMAARM